MKREITSLALYSSRNERDRLAIEAINRVNDVMSAEYGGRLPVTQIIINLAKFYLDNSKK